MRKLLFLFAIISFSIGTKAQTYVTIPDANFVAWLNANVPAAMNGNQMDITSPDVTSLSYVDLTGINISDLSGIEYFSGASVLNCSNNPLVTLSSLPPLLSTLLCENCQLTSIPSLPGTLISLECPWNSLTALPTLPTSLERISCHSNQIVALPALPSSLKKLVCNYNQIINLPNLPTILDTLECSENALSSLPLLPNSLLYLDCSSNSISSLPNLPSNLKILYCSFNQLTTLPSLPNSLQELWCDFNQLNSLPVLPNGLTALLCVSNFLTSLPTLPNSIQVIDCNGNSLTSPLPALPTSLYDFNCRNNSISTIPTLPNNLNRLDCSFNAITSLPSLPNNLGNLICNSNQLTTLPDLKHIVQLECENNSITCFPRFPNSIAFPSNLKIANNPFTCLPNYIAAMDATTLNYPLCISGNTVTNPNGCSGAEGIYGTTYKDNNTNCIKNSSDPFLNNISVKLFNQTQTLISQSNSFSSGLYSFAVNTDTYTVVIDTIGKPYTYQCIHPGIDSLVALSPANPLVENVNFALKCKPGFDLGIQSITTNGMVFPGQTHTLALMAGDISKWYNLNCASGVGGQLSLQVIGPLTYIGPANGALTPTVTGNIYTYNLANFFFFNNTTFGLKFSTNTNAQANDQICVSATITPAASGDNNISNNTFTYCYHVINSFDPNFKEVSPIDVEPGYNDWFNYTIHFQNTGNAPAIDIHLEDTLDNNLDMNTFEVINYSHYNKSKLKGNILTFDFPHIMLPDSASNPSGSLGFVQYRIKPKATWASPNQIKNTAYIYFDFNAPIVTNTTLNSIILPTGLINISENISALYPNPTNGTFTIELNTKEKQLIQLYDIAGNTVLSQTIENGKGTIDGSHLSAGIYTIGMKGSAGVTNKKLVIVK